ncbi:MAG: hypothetical protein ABI237_05850 [Ginsengibacter sp.]
MGKVINISQDDGWKKDPWMRSLIANDEKRFAKYLLQYEITEKQKEKERKRLLKRKAI